jgi:hypothetical protein
MRPDVRRDEGAARALACFDRTDLGDHAAAVMRIDLSCGVRPCRRLSFLLFFDRVWHERVISRELAPVGA